jgi:hypothetical protein
VVDGVRIAKRAHPGTRRKTWISIEPGWAVHDDRSADEWAIEIEHRADSIGGLRTRLRVFMLIALHISPDAFQKRPFTAITPTWLAAIY